MRKAEALKPYLLSAPVTHCQACDAPLRDKLMAYGLCGTCLKKSRELNNAHRDTPWTIQLTPQQEYDLYDGYSVEERLIIQHWDDLLAA